jgi:hypothetical protein
VSDEEFPRVIIVMLRQPRSRADESRSDPYWEFGSFGTTGCHSRSVMNRSQIAELDGCRFAFAQGGPAGFRLVHVTPVLRARYLEDAAVCEAKWNPAEMPLRYDKAPCLIDNAGQTDFPSLKVYFQNVRRTSWVARFASAFRTTRRPVSGVVGLELLRIYEQHRGNSGAIAGDYVDALPYPPPRAESAAMRKRSYLSRTKINIRRC